MTVDEIVRRVRERSTRLASGLPVSLLPVDSDFSLNGVVPLPEKWRSASVLVPLVVREPAITVLLTQRTEDMPSHAGQIAFPGGGIETGESEAEALCRELCEELGTAIRPLRRVWELLVLIAGNLIDLQVFCLFVTIS